jgi:hypothetical protein
MVSTKNRLPAYAKIFLLINILALSLLAPVLAALVVGADFYINGGPKNRG